MSGAMRRSLAVTALVASVAGPSRGPTRDATPLRGRPSPTQAVLHRAPDTAQTVTLEVAGRDRLARALPWGYSVPHVAPTDQEELPFVHAHPFAWVEGPLTFDSDRGTFETTVAFVLLDSVALERVQPVEPPMVITLASDADSLERTRIDLGRTGFPAERVRVVALHPGASIALDLRTPADSRRVGLLVPVRPTLVIRTPTRAIRGWGLGVYEVTVEAHGARPEDDIAIDVSVSGTVEDADLHMGTARTTRFSVRSQGLGRTLMRVSAPGFVPAETVFAYGFPSRFFGWGLLGAVVGGAVGARRARARRRALLRRACIGIGAVLVYLVLGVPFLPVESLRTPVVEIGALVVALLTSSVTPERFRAARPDGG